MSPGGGRSLNTLLPLLSIHCHCAKAGVPASVAHAQTVSARSVFSNFMGEVYLRSL
jgi:hypothetical protein